MKDMDKTKEQLIDELCQMRQGIGEISDRLNNILTAIFGNIALARIDAEKGETRSKIIERLANAEKTLTEINGLTRRLLSLLSTPLEILFQSDAPQVDFRIR